jgi:hypothetical protein
MMLTQSIESERDPIYYILRSIWTYNILILRSICTCNTANIRYIIWSVPWTRAYHTVVSAAAQRFS